MKNLLNQKLFRKLQAFILTLALMVGNFSGVLVDAAQSNLKPLEESSRVNSEFIQNEDDGVISMNKYGIFSKKITNFDTKTGIVDIELSISGIDRTATGDDLYIALVIDKSRSMQDNAGETKLEDTVNTLIDNLQKNPNAKKINLGIVEFNKEAEVYAGMQNISKHGRYSARYFKGATNTALGIIKATEMLKNVTDKDAKKAMIILTDGEPTFGVKNCYTKKEKKYVASDYYMSLASNDDDWQYKFDSYRIEKKRKGGFKAEKVENSVRKTGRYTLSKDSIIIEEGSWIWGSKKVEYKTLTSSDGKKYYVRPSEIKHYQYKIEKKYDIIGTGGAVRNDLKDSARRYADLARNEINNLSIYPIGITLGSGAFDFMSSLAKGEGRYINASKIEDLTQILSKVVDSIISKSIQALLITDTMGKMVTLDTSSVEIFNEKGASIKDSVSLNVENNKITLYGKDSSLSLGKDEKIIVKYKVKLNYENDNFEFNKFYDTNSEAEATFKDKDDPNYRAKLYFKKPKAKLPGPTYKVEYYKDGKIVDEFTKTIEVSKGKDLKLTDDKIGAYIKDGNEKLVGYKLDNKKTDKSTFKDDKVSLDGSSTLKLYYITDNTQKYSYKIEYYKDNELWKTDEGKEVNKANPTVKADSLEKTPEGYKIEKITPELPTTITEKNNVIKVYYKTNVFPLTIKKTWENIDSKKQNIPDEVQVKVNRSLDGTLDSNFTETVTLSKENRWLHSIDVDIQPQDKDVDYIYTVEEVKVLGFKVKEGSQKIIKSKDGKKLIANIVNIPDTTAYIDLDIIKMDKDGKEKLAGAIFNIKAVKGNADSSNIIAYNKSITTNIDGRASFRLGEGNYEITEIKAPKGYVANSDEKYNLTVEKDDKGKLIARAMISDNDNIILEKSNNDTFILNVTNTKLQSNKIYKMDQNGKAIGGVKFDLYKKTGNIKSVDNKNLVNYNLHIEVDNSLIGGEEFIVKAELLKGDVTDNDNLANPIMLLNNGILNDRFDNLASGSYKVKFTFDNRFTGDVKYDKDTSTVILTLGYSMLGNLKADLENNVALLNELSNVEVDENINITNNVENNESKKELTENNEATEEKSEENANIGANEVTDDTNNEIEITKESTDINTDNTSVVWMTQFKDETPISDNEKADISANLSQKIAEIEKSILELSSLPTENEKTSDWIVLGEDVAKDGYTLIGQLTSNENGQIDLDNLENGEYYLSEVEVPTVRGGHYEKSDGIFEFSIIDNGIIKLPEDSNIIEISEENGIQIYKIENKWIEDTIPSTPNTPNTPDIPTPTPDTPGIPTPTPDTPNNPTPTPTPDTPNPSNPTPYVPVDPNYTPNIIINDNDIPLVTPNKDVYIKEEKIILDGDESISDDEIPLSGKIKENDVIVDDDVPLKGIPKTGDSENMMFEMMTLTMGMGLIYFVLKSRKKR